MSTKSAVNGNHLISRELSAFLIDRQARMRSKRTIEFYQQNLEPFGEWLVEQGCESVEAINATHIRQYMILKSETRNAGGVHAVYRSIKAWLTWWGTETDDRRWRNPILKVEAPGISKEPLPGISRDDVGRLLLVCPRNFYGQRDKAIILGLYDSGLRRNEFLKLDFGDIDLKTGAVQVRKGKGNKDRTAFMGARARRELIRYLRYRSELLPNHALWVTGSGTRLTPAGLREIIRRRSKDAGIETPGLHDFRRAYAIESLRNGIDLVTLARLMGHTSLNVLQRYLDLLTEDLQRSHERSSPADNL